MTDDTVATGKAPWHFWLVCALGAVWNGFGGFDFVMSVTKGDAYFRSAGMTEAQIAAFHAMPAWMNIVWVLGVWGAVIGTVLLILRRRWAVHAFAASLLGAVLSALYQYVLAGGAASPGVMPAVIVAGAVFFLWYAWFASKKGLLR